jgi:hypothetical protein
MPRISVTRAVKNLKHIQAVAPLVRPSLKPPGGYISLIPPNLLPKLHRLREVDVRNRADLLDLVTAVKLGVTKATAVVPQPLFNGTLYFVRVVFNTNQQDPLHIVPISVTDADMQTAVQYATLAAIPISDYASLYGLNSLTVSQTILQFTVTLQQNTYDAADSDAQLQGWVNQIVQDNNLPTSTCIVILNPQGVTNLYPQVPAGEMVLGYHAAATVPYCAVNVYGTNFTIDDRQDVYAGTLSHEIAEMTVDPYSIATNPEVCDACTTNCWPTQPYRIFFGGATNGYIETTDIFPPNFGFNFFISGIVQPTFDFSTTCPDSSQKAALCVYGPPVFGKVVIGTDSQVYVHPFDRSDNPIGNYILIPGKVKTMSMTRDSRGRLLIFVIGTDDQVYVHQFNAKGTAVGPYVPVSGKVKAICGSQDSTGTPLLFVIGTDDQAYVHLFDANGTPVPTYVPIYDKVKAISSVGDRAGTPLLFVIGTDDQVYVHRFDAYDNPLGQYVVIPGKVKAILGSRDGGGKSLLFVIGTDDQVYVHQFDANGNPVGPYTPIPDKVKAISCSWTSAALPLLFVIGTDDQVYAHQFDAGGNPVGSYIPISGKVKAISGGRDSVGRPLLFVVGTDDQVYVHQFDGNDNPSGSYVLIPDKVQAV